MVTNISFFFSSKKFFNLYVTEQVFLYLNCFSLLILNIEKFWLDYLISTRNANNTKVLLIISYEVLRLFLDTKRSKGRFYLTSIISSQLANFLIYSHLE